MSNSNRIVEIKNYSVSKKELALYYRLYVLDTIRVQSVLNTITQELLEVELKTFNQFKEASYIFIHPFRIYPNTLNIN